jgi:hypothetical protein
MGVLLQRWRPLVPGYPAPGKDNWALLTTLLLPEMSLLAHGRPPATRRTWRDSRPGPPWPLEGPTKDRPLFSSFGPSVRMVVGQGGPKAPARLKN